jgi:hypothetical protein
MAPSSLQQTDGALSGRRDAAPSAASRAAHLPPAPARAPSATSYALGTAVAALIALQDEYRAWLDNLPDNLEGSRFTDKL